VANVADRIWGMVVAGDHVYWLGRHGRDAVVLGRQYLVSFATATRTYAVRANDGPIDLSISDGYIYWTSQHRVHSIKRMPLDAPVLYHIQ